MMRFKQLTVASIALIWFALPFETSAVPALGTSRMVQQPDGNQFQAVQKGDEWSNHIENKRGYAVSRGADGVWRYVRGYGHDRKPLLGPTPAHRPAPPGLQKHLAPPSSRPKMAPGAGTSEAGPSLAAPTGSMSAPVLFILAEFDDRAGTTSENSWGDFVSNNVRDYFLATSHGNATLNPASETFDAADGDGSGADNDGVIGWVNLGATHPDTYGAVDNRNRNLARDAILAADPYVDFSTYDTDGNDFIDGHELAIVVIVAGYETAFAGTLCSPRPAVWGHQWGWSVNHPLVDDVEINSYAQFGERHFAELPCFYSGLDHQATMGIMVHELGHLVFDLPDLYDTDGSSAGIGSFGVMGSGSWGWTDEDYFDGGYEGATPVNACAWTKVQMDWAAAQEGSGTETIAASGLNPADSNGVVFRASTSGPATEYFLVENRQNVGYDAGLEGLLSSSWFVDFGGLAIWHIDDSKSSNANDARRWVDFEEADSSNMEDVDYGRGHPTALWFAGNPDSANADHFDDSSSPDSKLYESSSSGVDINTISASSDMMSAIFGAGSPPPLNPPVIPTEISSLDGKDGTAEVSWRDNSYIDNSYNEDGFEVQREKKHKKRDTWTAQTMVAKTEANVTLIRDSAGAGTFRYRVRAFNSAGASDWTDWDEVTITESGSGGGGKPPKTCHGKNCYRGGRVSESISGFSLQQGQVMSYLCN